jgi:putative phosphonate metabolism protein
MSRSETATISLRIVDILQAKDRNADDLHEVHMTAPARYAIYVAPKPTSAVARFGASWLGRDAGSGQPVSHPTVDGLSDEEINAATTEPRRYGFHATLKAPFRLAEGRAEFQLIERLKVFVELFRPITIPDLQLADLAGFIALIPSHPSAPLNALAAAAVRDFDDFRAPPTPSELERRQPDRLSTRQRELLSLWGYPYVMEEYRFHMTLTDKLDDTQRAKIMDKLVPLMAPFNGKPLLIDDLALFVQQAPDSPFILLARFPLRSISLDDRASAGSVDNARVVE